MQNSASVSAASQVNQAVPESSQTTQTRFWPEGWWKLMEIRIGIIPLPIYVILFALIAGFAVTGKVPGEISMAIA
ncbi:malate permease, partial [Paraburkholderia sp. BR14261]